MVLIKNLIIFKFGNFILKLTFEKLFPNREIMMLETENVNYGGGNIHCITMNVPKI